MIKQITTGIVLILLLLLVANPMHFWMPTMAHITILVFLIILFGVFASFVLREVVVDERDNKHRMLAGRNAFLVGSIVLVIGIIFQELVGEVDLWLIITLVVMIVAKIASRLYSDSNL